ncbi:MAG TPA: single-stranded-DNA-specific exonuclease RecJ, partial [Firmicutes bacterium]|nr:single-stranded-DNA-specific exonuclease RecJ [Bacillota bacterium]
WHEGVIGIVASKITEKFNKPTILFASEDMYSKGSGRSVDGFNLYNALSSCSKFIDAFGGHSMAAGLRIKNENIENLENCLNKIASNIKDTPDVKSLTVDMAIPLGIINDTLYQSISYLAPFGPGNPKPIFASFNVPIKYEPRIVGNGHVKFKFSTSAGNTIDGIFFNGKEYLSEINGNNVDICYTLQENNYMGRHSVELNIADIRNASTKE